MSTFMSSYLLSHQGDRVAMAHGVEVRYPFLDPAVVELAAGLPPRLKLPGLRDKVALRRLASRSLPAEIWQRPKKPYRAPMAPPLFSAAGPDYVADLLSPDSVERLGLLDPAATARLTERARARDGRMSGEREEMALVGALTLQSLGQQYLVELPGRAAALRRRLGPTPNVLVDATEAGARANTHPLTTTAGGRP
jgi:asparagine synthase (glutamine-hydrolysing)